MKIEHIALWTGKLEDMKNFYVSFFGGNVSLKYENEHRQFHSYFITFDSGARLELMSIPILLNTHGTKGEPLCGYTHLALSVGSEKNVDEMTERIRNSGYKVVSEPRVTGDGYYESCILDPDGNLIELTI